MQKIFIGERTEGGEEMTRNSSKEVWKQGDQIMAEVMIALMSGYEIDSIVKLFAEPSNLPVRKRSSIRSVKKATFSIRSLTYKTFAALSVP